MSQPGKEIRETVEKIGDLTPAAKTPSRKCSPAPVKRGLDAEHTEHQKPSLTKKETRQLRKSWKNLTNDMLKD